MMRYFLAGVAVSMVALMWGALKISARESQREWDEWLGLREPQGKRRWKEPER